MLTLYYAKGTAALAAHILLEESGADYDIRRLDFSAGQQRDAAYLAINPKGRVPALRTPDGTLTETPAILAYIAQAFPKAELAPPDPFAFATAQAFNTYLAATVHVAHAHQMRGARWADDPVAHVSMAAKVTENMAECCRMIEAHYFKGPWVLGDDYSMCDPYLLTIGRWAVADGVVLDTFSQISAHAARMQARPATRTVLALHD